MTAEQRRDQAWNRYASIPHADIDVGWAEYLAEIEAIEADDAQIEQPS